MHPYNLTGRVHLIVRIVQNFQGIFVGVNEAEIQKLDTFNIWFGFYGDFKFLVRKTSQFEYGKRSQTPNSTLLTTFQLK